MCPSFLYIQFLFPRSVSQWTLPPVSRWENSANFSCKKHTDGLRNMDIGMQRVFTGTVRPGLTFCLKKTWCFFYQKKKSCESMGTPQMPPLPGNKALLKDYIKGSWLLIALFLGRVALGGALRFPRAHVRRCFWVLHIIYFMLAPVRIAGWLSVEGWKWVCGSQFPKQCQLDTIATGEFPSRLGHPKRWFRIREVSLQNPMDSGEKKILCNFPR